MLEALKKYNVSKTFFNRYFELNAINRLGNELYRFMNFKEGKFINPMKKQQYIEDYVKEEIDNFYNKKELNIPSTRNDLEVWLKANQYY